MNMSKGNRRLSRSVIALLIVMALCGCASAPTQTPFDAEAAASQLVASRLGGLLRSGSTEPTLVDWADVEANRLLTTRQRDNFCTRLDSPVVDTVLGSLLAGGLNALSLKLRRRPLAEDTKQIVDLAAKFAVKACPLWVPNVIPDRTLAPILRWYPTGFSPLIADPEVAWRWIRPEDAVCDHSGKCWNVEVVAREGCSDLFLAVSNYDSAGVVVDVGHGSVGATAPEVTTRVEITSDVLSSTKATVDFIACL